MQELYYAKGQASTISAIQDLDSSSNILTLLNEPWISNTGLLLVSANYKMFYPTTSPKCITCIKKELNLHPSVLSSYDDSILSLWNYTHLGLVGIVNVYISKPNSFFQ